MSIQLKKIKPKLAERGNMIIRSGLNLPYTICNHVIGKNHTIKHRIVVGVILMICGVSIAQAGAGVSIIVLHYAMDAFGYFVHGLGTMPFIELIHLKNDHQTEIKEAAHKSGTEKIKVVKQKVQKHTV